MTIFNLIFKIQSESSITEQEDEEDDQMPDDDSLDDDEEQTSMGTNTSSDVTDNEISKLPSTSRISRSRIF